MEKIKHLLLSLIFVSSAAFGQLAAGDIAFLGMNTDAQEGFAFITLNDIPGGEEIYFSDRGVVNASSWNVSIEMTLIFTAPPAGIPCGTVVSLVETGADIITITGVAGASTTFLTTPFNLGAGDQITAFQYAPAGFPPTPGDATFIAGIHTNHEDGCVELPFGLDIGGMCFQYIRIRNSPGFNKCRKRNFYDTRWARN